MDSASGPASASCSQQSGGRLHTDHRSPCPAGDNRDLSPLPSAAVAYPSPVATSGRQPTNGAKRSAVSELDEVATAWTSSHAAH